MIPWAESRFSRVISSRRQDLFIVFIRVKALVRALFSVHVVTRKLKKSVTYYFNVRNPPHEKNIAKKFRKSLEVMFYNTTFAPAFERERRFRNDGNVEVSLGRGWGWLGQAIISNRPEIGLRKKLENFSPKNLEVKKKSLPLQPQSRNDSDKSSLRDLHNSTSSTSIRKRNFPD